MSRIPTTLRGAALVALALLAPLAGPARSQVLVYRLEFDQTGKSLNFQFFNGGYFVAPLLGGAGTLLLTSRGDQGFLYSQAADSGQLFAGTERDGDAKAILASASTNGTGRTGFFAIGDVEHTQKIKGPSFQLSAKVAKVLVGMAFAADDQSETTEPLPPGVVGLGGMAKFEAHIDESWTKRVNSDGQDVDEAAETLAAFLESRGYTEYTPSSTDTDTDTDTETD